MVNWVLQKEYGKELIVEEFIEEHDFYWGIIFTDKERRYAF